MRKMILILMVAFFAFSVCACSSGGSESGASSMPDITAQTTPKPTEAPKNADVVIVNTDGVNIRASADTEAEVYTQAYTDEAFLLVKKDVKDGWHQIKYDGKDAFISSEFTKIETMTAEEAAAKTGTGDAPADPAAEDTPTPTPDDGTGTAASRGNEDGQKR